MGVNMFSAAYRIFAPVVSGILSFLLTVFGCVFWSLVVFVVLFLLRYRMYGKHLRADRLAELQIKFKPYDFARWKMWDFLTREQRRGQFKEFGFSIFVGRQGGGKTISMVEYMDIVRAKYPDVIIVTNFSYDHADRRMESWRDLFDIRNDEKGVIFALDEIHSEYSAEDWKDFPESILSEISQQRKQKVKIVASSQVFGRVVKQIREQTFSVLVCRTFAGRWTFVKEYDAAEYGVSSDSPHKVKKHCKPVHRWSFVQSNALRESYDTYEKVERLKGREFIPRGERGT